MALRGVQALPGTAGPLSGDFREHPWPGAVAVMHYFDIFSCKLEARKWNRASRTMPRMQTCATTP
jgi:hypothetical protein